MYNQNLKSNLKKTKEFFEKNRNNYDSVQKSTFFEKNKYPNTAKREEAINDINEFKNQLNEQFNLANKLRKSDPFQRALYTARKISCVDGRNSNNTSRAQTAYSYHRNPYSDVSHLKDQYLEYKNVKTRPTTANTNLNFSKNQSRLLTSQSHRNLSRPSTSTVKKVTCTRQTEEREYMDGTIERNENEYKQVFESTFLRKSSPEKVMLDPEFDEFIHSNLENQYTDEQRMMKSIITSEQENISEGIVGLTEKLEKDNYFEHKRIKTITEAFITDEQHEVKEFNKLRNTLGQPTARVEVKSLVQYLDQSLMNILDMQGLSVKEVFIKSMEIYERCFKEVIRQVSVHCVERGYLIHRIWRAYITLFRKIVELYEQDVKTAEDCYEQKNNEIKQDFVTKKQTYSNEISDLKKQLDKKNMDYMKLLEDYKISESKLRYTIEEMDSIRAHNDDKLEQINEISKQQIQMLKNEMNPDASFKKRKKQLDEMKNQIINNELSKKLDSEHYTEYGINATVTMSTKSIETSNMLVQLDQNYQVGLSAHHYKPKEADTTDLIEYNEVGIGPIKVKGSTLIDQDSSIHVNTIYDEKSEVYMVKETFNTVSDELNKYKELLRNMENSYETKINTYIRDIDMHRKQIKEYKEENMQLRKEKRDIKMDYSKKRGQINTTLDKNGKQIKHTTTTMSSTNPNTKWDPNNKNSTFKSYANNNELNNQNIQSYNNNTTLESSSHFTELQTLNRTAFENHDKILYYTIDAHKLDYELKKATIKIDNLNEEISDLKYKNSQYEDLVKEMMMELDKVQNILSITKNVKDKSIGVDTYMDDCPMELGDTMPYEIKIDLQSKEKYKFDAPSLTKRLTNTIDILSHKNAMLPQQKKRYNPFTIKTKVADALQQKKCQMHIVHSLIHSLKLKEYNDIVNEKNISTLIVFTRQLLTLLADKFTSKSVNMPFNEFTFNSFFAKYGLRDMTEGKMVTLLCSTIKYCRNYRVSNFGHMLGLYGSWGMSEQTNYLILLDKLTSTGSTIEENNQVYLNNSIAVNVIDAFYKTVFNEYDFNSIVSMIGENKYIKDEIVYVNIDYLCYETIEKIRQVEHGESDWLDVLSSSIDIYESKMLEYWQLDLLLRLLEPSKYSKNMVHEIFRYYYKNTDFMISEFETYVLTRAVFKDVCAERGLFLKNSLLAFCPDLKENAVTGLFFELYPKINKNLSLIQALVTRNKKYIVEELNQAEIIPRIESWISFILKNKNLYKHQLQQYISYYLLVAEVENLFNNLNCAKSIPTLNQNISKSYSTIALFKQDDHVNIKTRAKNEPLINKKDINL